MKEREGKDGDSDARVSPVSPIVSAAKEAAMDVHASYLPPYRLFVAWNGVLVLTFDGFSPGLVTVKERLASRAQELGLSPENFGSKWPKTTIAALRDDASSLSREQFRNLRRLCETYDDIVEATSPLLISNLTVVDYECRSLEEITGRVDITLLKPISNEKPSKSEHDRVARVLSEWDDAERYLEKVNAPGSRASSYRHESPNGATLVAFWGEMKESSDLLGLLAAFRRDVDTLLPGYYEWHEASSFHCTLRSLGSSHICA